MEILITGSNGFLGSKIKYELKGHDIKTLSRSNSTYNFDLASNVPMFDSQFDLVIHAAGKAHSIPKSDIEKQEFYFINVKGTKNLLDGLSKSGVPKYFVFISSVSVYGNEIGYEIDESYTLRALDPYGLSKIEAEQNVVDWCEKNNVICTVLRLPLVVGTNPPGNLKSMINAIKHNFYFNITGGNARKSMVLASDVSKYIIKAAEIGGIFNLTDGCHPNFKELSNLISLQFGKKFVPNMPLIVAKLLAFIGDIIGPQFPINSIKLMKITSTLTFNDSNARKAFNWDPTPVLKGFKINE